ncbi:MAG: polyprenyl synthetase family protein [Lachnospiraceae bacterium]|nr:polyprenyl synthetase family protein [Lachnospiraceae bacterium]
MERFEEELQARAEQAEEVILAYLPPVEGRQKVICEAMGYSFRSGGKRLRPIMMREAFLLFDKEEKNVHPFMAALEMIHTYSLIHDDLPEMDNDDLRRGLPTCHVKYGQAMAVLAGDGLLNLAFETVTEALSQWENETLIRGAKAASILAKRAGYRGMIGGQVVDILAEEPGHVSDEEELTFIHANKTSALLQAALTIGGVMGGANEEQVEKLSHIGYLVGLAFQIRDDILDVTGSQEELGKPIGSDERNEKSTYVSLVGLEAAGEKVRSLSKQAMEELEQLPGDKTFLQALFAYLIERRK